MIKQKLDQKKSKKIKTFFSNDSKSSCFFIISLIVVCFLLYNFIPHCYQLTIRNNSNNNIKFFSDLLSSLDQFTKYTIIISQIVIILIILSINNTIKNKLLEIDSFNMISYLNIYLFSFLSIVSITCLTFYPQYTDDITKQLSIF